MVVCLRGSEVGTCLVLWIDGFWTFLCIGVGVKLVHLGLDVLL